MTPGNWVGDVAPVPGDSLIFPGVMSGGNETNHNNYPNGTVFGNISIDTAKGQDYAIGGNRVLLANGIAEGSTGFGAGGAFVFFNITLTNNQSFTASGGLTLNNTIDTDGYSLIMNNSGGVLINGILTNGTAGQMQYGEALVKTNTGTLTISSSAIISPPAGLFNVILSEGTLAMKGTAGNSRFDLFQGSLIVDGTIGGLNVLGAGVSVSGTGNFGSTEDEILTGSATFTPGDNGAPGIMQFDSFEPLSGNDSLQIVINGTQPGTGYGQFLVTSNYSLSSGDIYLYSPMALALQWNYAPQVGDSFLVLTQASLAPYSVAGIFGSSYFFAGLPPNSILDATNGASLGVSYNADGITLTTLRTATSPFVLWKGSATDIIEGTGQEYASRDWSATNNWAQNVGLASGDVLDFGPYQLTCYTNYYAFVPIPPVTNDLANGTSLAGLVFTGSNYIMYGNPITVTGGITNDVPAGTNFFHLGLAAAGAFSLDVEPGGPFLMDGVIAGSGTVSKTGGGLLLYTGVTSDAFVGAVAVNNGTLQMDGSFTDGSFTVNGGTLDGTGTVSAVTVNSGGILKPGDSPGILHVDGNLAMAPGGLLTAELDGPLPGSEYDQLQVSGSVNLNGATLNLQPNFAAGAGAAFIILVNNGAGAITGTFAGLPEGAVFQAGGQYFSITYQGGAGNKSAVVTRVNPPGYLTRILSLPPTAVELFGAGGTNATYTILANTNLTTTNWIDIGTAPANGSGSFFFYDSNTLVYPQRFYKIQPP